MFLLVSWLPLEGNGSTGWGKLVRGYLFTTAKGTRAKHSLIFFGEWCLGHFERAGADGAIQTQVRGT